MVTASVRPRTSKELPRPHQQPRRPVRPQERRRRLAALPAPGRTARPTPVTRQGPRMAAVARHPRRATAARATAAARATTAARAMAAARQQRRPEQRRRPGQQWRPSKRRPGQQWRPEQEHARQQWRPEQRVAARALIAAYGTRVAALPALCCDEAPPPRPALWQQESGTFPRGSAMEPSGEAMERRRIRMAS